MDALAITEQLPLGAFVRRSRKQAREPDEWGTDGAAIGKMDGQLIFGYSHGSREGTGFNR